MFRRNGFFFGYSGHAGSALSGVFGLVAALAALVAFAGCAGYYERSADREVAPIVRDLNARVDVERVPETPQGVLAPKPGGPEIRTEVSAAAGPAETINLEQSLAMAFSTSRDFRSQKESLYLSALSFTGVRHQYDWRPSAVLSGDVTANGSGDAPTSTSAAATATLALTRRLLSGGTFAVSASGVQGGRLGGGATDDNASNLGLTFSQPLLAGAGLAAREALFQAQRGLLYDARDFELFRQSLAIDVISRYYGLLRQKRFIETARANMEQSRFLYERSQALFEKGRLSRVDAFRAEQEYLQAQNSLSDEIESYNLSLDRFKIFLGIATDRNLDIADQPLTPEIITVDLGNAVRTALENRLDLTTARQQLEDSERSVKIARNTLLPELDFFARGNLPSEGRGDFLDFAADSGGSASAGLTLVLPVDKKNERNAYKASIISLTRQRRSYDLALDNVKLDVRDTVRNLRQAEVTLAIQAKNVELAKSRLEAAQLLFEKGDNSNRDIVEAQTALQDAQNSYVQAQVDYLIATIQLRKDIGTLRVDETGKWY